MGAYGMIRVYICSPFRAADDEGRKRNVDYAKELVRQAVDRGWAPFAPHLYLPGVLDDADAEQREAGMCAGLAFLETCDAVIVGAKHGISEGMAREIRYAKALGIPRKDASEEG